MPKGKKTPKKGTKSSKAPAAKKAGKKAGKKAKAKSEAVETITPQQRLERARDLAKTFNKKLAGAGRIDVGADIEELEYQFIRTEIAAIDFVTNGGIIRGRLSEWWGPDGSSKTTATAHLAKALQRRGQNVALCPIEGIDKGWWRTNGVFIPYGPDEIKHLEPSQQKAAHRYNKMYLDAGWAPLTVIQHKAPDEALDLVYEMTLENVYDCIIVDSLAMVVGGRQIDAKKPSDEGEYGGNAPLIGRWVKFMQSAFNTFYDQDNNISRKGRLSNRTAVVCINQARDTIGSQAYSEWKTMHPPGGWGLKHGKSQSIFFGKVEDHGPMINYDGKKRRDVVAKTFRVHGVKMRGGPEGRDARFTLYLRDWEDEDGFSFHAGQLDNAPTLRALGVMLGIVEQTGAYYTYGETRIQGKENFDQMLRENREVYEELYEEMIETARTQAATGVVPTEIR